MAETASNDKTTTTRDRVYLKSGMGSVAAADYDDKIHGKALELTDEEYEARRMRGVIPGVTVAKDAPLTATPFQARATGVAPGHTTTIAGLQTFDPASQPTPTPAPPAPAPIAAAPVGKAVATVDGDQKAGDAKASDQKAAEAKK